ncbi:MAG TPA: thioesterase family protein [Thermoplasmata archaeon]|jgi:acyl-CoA thioester hydrolase|nr:thioesterase family protein [Thermoplasmata archaeon]
MGPDTKRSDLSTSWPTQRRFTVFYHDLDVLGHLNHAVYFPYMETLRCDYYLRTIGSLDPSQLDIILAEASCRYLAPAFYGTEMIGEVAPSSPLGRTSFSLLYRFRDPNDATKVYARGRTVVVCYDYATNSKKEIPKDRREILERDGVDPASEGW